jgi:DNA invertase Pin-like site-specific DNA recombinase
MNKLIAYLRTSTAKKTQGVTGYSFESQIFSIEQYAKRTGATIIATFSEQESGAVNNRPELMKALELAKTFKGEATICIAKLDRLSRDAAFLIQLSKSGVQFKCMDMPECDHFTISLFAVLAERERVTIAARVKAAMEAAKRRGTKLGGPNPELSVKLMNAGAKAAKENFNRQLIPVIEEIKSAGVKTLQGIADALNRRGYVSRRENKFYASTVRAILA